MKPFFFLTSYPLVYSVNAGIILLQNHAPRQHKTPPRGGYSVQVGDIVIWVRNIVIWLTYTHEYRTLVQVVSTEHNTTIFILLYQNKRLFA